MSRLAFSLAFTIVFLLNQSIDAQTPTWPQFLGAGSTENLESQSLPDEFGPDKNVRWRTETPAGSSSPCIWGDRLFLTGFTDDRCQPADDRRGSGCSRITAARFRR